MLAICQSKYSSTCFGKEKNVGATKKERDREGERE
jgi:hypothetical protein